MITLISPENNIEISLMTDVLKEFERCERSGRHRAGEQGYAWMGNNETNIVSGRILNAPVSVFFKWKTDDPTKPVNFEISLDSNFASDDSVYGKCATIGEPVASHEGDGVYVVRAENLYSGRRYYWRVSDGTLESEVRTFTTRKRELRTIRADTLKNVRDIGGWQTESGKYVKQGLLYRGPAFKECFTMHLWHIFMEDLGIKTEIDLREEAIGSEFDTLLGPLCNYLQIPIDAYGEVYIEKFSGNIKKIFNVLSDPTAYPIYLHCAAGADRTGTIAYLLEAVLGLREDDIIFEYNLTAASYDTPNFNRDLVNDYLTKMEETYPGSTLCEKLIYTLREQGVTDEMMENIRNIFLED